MIALKSSEIPSKNCFNPEKMIQKYNYNNNVLSKEIEKMCKNTLQLGCSSIFCTCS